MAKVSHIDKAPKKVQDKLASLNKQMKAEKFIGTDGKPYLPRMAIVEIKLTEKEVALVDRMVADLGVSKKKAEEIFTKNK